jgi:hypothetical protein
MRKFITALAAFLTIFIVTFATQAQITTGSISGTVTDAAGAVVPGATVTVRSDTGQQYTATTNEDGYYSIPGVQAGTINYEVR